jgi:arginyl-tRNA synthetase
MIFEAARVAGWLVPPARAQHVSFGMVLGPDGKKFGTRAGGSVRLMDLLDEAIERGRAAVAAKNPDLALEAREHVARMVGIGAVKYADLSSDRVKAYVFDFDRMLSFDGNTAPYIQYAHARCRSIIRKSGAPDASAPDASAPNAAAPNAAAPNASAIALEKPQERALALTLLRFPTAVDHVAEALQPHLVCTYLYDLATAFSAFYEACPVLKADTEAARQSRLALTELTARVLARGLGLLGIEAPDEM